MDSQTPKDVYHARRLILVTLRSHVSPQNFEKKKMNVSKSHRKDYTYIYIYIFFQSREKCVPKFQYCFHCDLSFRFRSRLIYATFPLESIPISWQKFSRVDSLNLCQLLLTRLITRRLSSSSVRFLRNRWLETRLVNMKKKRKKKERKRKKKKVARRDCSFKKKKKLKLRDAFMRLPDIARHWNSYFLIGTHHRRRRHARESKGRGEQSKIGHETRCKSFDSGWILGRIDASVRRTVNEERKGRWILFSLSFFFW